MMKWQILGGGRGWQIKITIVLGFFFGKPNLQFCGIIIMVKPKNMRARAWIELEARDKIGGW